MKRDNMKIDISVEDLVEILQALTSRGKYAYEPQVVACKHNLLEYYNDTTVRCKDCHYAFNLEKKGLNDVQKM